MRFSLKMKQAGAKAKQVQDDNGESNKYYYQSLIPIMIRSIRMRPLQKPIITQQIIYHHQQELLDTNSDISFLKMSQKTSKQLTNPDIDSFSALETHLNTLAQRSKLKLNCLQSNIKCLETGKDCQSKRSLSQLSSQQIIDENKQNAKLTYRQLALFADETQVQQECKFQMDENRNYIKSTILNSRNRDNMIVSQKPSKRQFYSLQISRKLSSRQNEYQDITFEKNKTKLAGTLTNNGQTKKRSSSLTKSNSRKIKAKSQERGKPAVIDSDIKKGRIYEYILSHYSIPKLLAMQPKKHEK